MRPVLRWLPAAVFPFLRAILVSARRRAVYLVVCSLVLVGGSAAQELKMFHKYTEPFCEFGRSSIDLLLNDIKEPLLKGVIVLHPSMSDPLGPYKERETIINHLKFRNFDESRIEFLLGEPELKSSIELWQAPASSPHGLTGRAWDMSVSDLTAPLLVHRTVWIDGIGCGLFMFRHEFFADVLRRNTSLVGRVVIRAPSNARFTAAKRKISVELIRTYKVRQQQLEFSFLKDKRIDTEYWLLPSGYLESL